MTAEEELEPLLAELRRTHDVLPFMQIKFRLMMLRGARCPTKWWTSCPPHRISGRPSGADRQSGFNWKARKATVPF